MRKLTLAILLITFVCTSALFCARRAPGRNTPRRSAPTKKVVAKAPTRSVTPPAALTRNSQQPSRCPSCPKGKTTPPRRR